MSQQHGGKNSSSIFQRSHISPCSKNQTGPPSLGVSRYPSPGITRAITNRSQSRGQGWKWGFERLFPAGICLPGLPPPRCGHSWGCTNGMGVPELFPLFPLHSLNSGLFAAKGPQRCGFRKTLGGEKVAMHRDTHKNHINSWKRGSLFKKEKEGKQTGSRGCSHITPRGYGQHFPLPGHQQ